MKIKVIREGKSLVFEGNERDSLLTQLRDQDIYISAACGGRGRCGKCKVQMTAGATEPSEADRACLKQEELAAGWRLACVAYPASDCTLVIDSADESEFAVVSSEMKGTPEEIAARVAEEQEYGIAIDIGTTTIAIALVGVKSGVLHAVTSINHQRAYGADVISRIQASNDGEKEALKESILQDLYAGMGRLLAESGADAEKVRRIAIAGNTTMGHLLMGYSCETLGVYPFTPVNVGTIRESFGGMFASQIKEQGAYALAPDLPVTLLPGITTYVGADISSGMLSCGFDRFKEPCLLIDLGTNGEMALGSRERILVTSTAAGPAFEGGNISCGMGSVPGAICNVTIEDGHAEIKTIGEQPPVGLCGTGVIETVYELVREELVDETGMLEEDYFDDGFVLAKTDAGEEIVFTQKDVREIQLAKSAVRAGVETLLRRYGIGYEQVGRVFLAGGFGYRVDLKKAVGIGMLPEELLDKTVAVGNSSLSGAVKYLQQEDAALRLDALIASSEEIELSSDRDFNAFYTEYMFFE